MKRENVEKHLIVSLHDLHPRSLDLIRQQKLALAEWGVLTASILLVPQFHHEQSIENHPQLIEELSAWQSEGHELVLHGYFHDRVGLPENLGNFFWTHLYTNHEAEFLDLFPLEAEDRLNKGRDLFANFGWNLRGFIAPAWLMAPGLTDLLRTLQFTYTNTLRSIIPLAEKRSPETTQSLCYSTRAFWRRNVSLLWNRFLFSRLLNQSVIRLSLHPNDFLYPPLKKQIEELIKTALQSGFKPITYADYVAR